MPPGGVHPIKSKLSQNLGPEILSGIPMIVDLAQCPGDLGELVVQEQEYPPLDRVGKNEIIDLGSMCLAVAMVPVCKGAPSSLGGESPR